MWHASLTHTTWLLYTCDATHSLWMRHWEWHCQCTPNRDQSHCEWNWEGATHSHDKTEMANISWLSGKQKQHIFRERVWRDLLACETRLNYVWHCVCACVLLWHIRMSSMTHPYVLHVHMCAILTVYVTCVCHMGHMHMCAILIPRATWLVDSCVFCGSLFDWCGSLLWVLIWVI